VKTAIIAAAILLCRPSMPKPEAGARALDVERGAAALGVDPILLVAMADHESGWIPSAVNKKSGALGLGQILPQFRPACAGGLGTKACAAERARLLDGAYNLAAMFDAIGAWKKSCKKVVGNDEEASWLTSYSGLNRPKAGEWCGWRATGGKLVRLPTHSVVREFLDRRQRLRKLLGLPA
jgi:hypothetical protein